MDAWNFPSSFIFLHNVIFKEIVYVVYDDEIKPRLF